MPICTYMSHSEVDSFKVTDKDVLEWKREVEKLTGEKLFIEEREVVVDRFLFRKSRKEKFYSLYWLHSGSEYQIHNFCGHGTSSLNTAVDKAGLVNFLIGMVVGLDFNPVTNRG